MSNDEAVRALTSVAGLALREDELRGLIEQYPALRAGFTMLADVSETLLSGDLGVSSRQH